jgi:elongation factor Ts
MLYIESYVHCNRIGVLLELETPFSFTAESVRFKQLAIDLGMQIAAANPMGITRQDTINVIPLRFKGAKASEDNTPLLLQRFLKDQSITVAERIDAVAREFKTTINVLRFSRFSVDDI